MNSLTLSALGEKIFLDRYSKKDPIGKIPAGARVLFTHPHTRQKEVGKATKVSDNGRFLWVQDSDGEVHPMRREEVDFPQETVTQALDRVATAAAGGRVDLEDRFAHILHNRQFIPAGRILESLGSGQTTTGVNCFVLPCPQDSRSGILHTLSQMTELMCKGGGVGINYSSLRPANAYVAGVNGRSSGAVSWMELFSFMTNLIIQGGSRRGAQMAMMAIWHPDVQQFIDLKRDNSRATGCNMSVVVSDEFMLAVRDDKEWVLRFPDTSSPDYNSLWDGDLEAWEARGLPTTVWSVVQARDLWDSICSSAHACAEPGVWFQDVANKARPSGNKMVATNPCVTGDTLIATVERGPVTFEELARSGADVKVWSWDPDTKQACVRWMRRPHKTREMAELLEVEFDSGLKLRLTPDHSLYTFRGKKVKARDLKIGKSVRAYAVSRHKDGQLRAHNGDSGNRYAHHLVWEEVNGPIPEGYVIHHKNENPEDNRVENLELVTPIEHNRLHYPARHANGFQGHKNFPEVLQKARDRELGVGNHKVVAIRQAEPADVYNGMVEGTHTYVICDPEYRGASGVGVFSGIVSANCGEQGLPGFSVCNLGHLYLPAFLQGDAWTIDGSILNTEALCSATRAGVRFLDRVVDVTKYPIPEAAQQQAFERRVGLGTLGLGEYLIRRGVRYGSEEAIAECEALYKMIAFSAYDESATMAQEFGPAVGWDPDQFVRSTFGRRLEKHFPELHEKVRRSGLRNVTLLTQAPTGTTGTMLGTSTGIEPYYLFEQVRKSRLGEHVERARIVEDYRSVHPGGDLPDYFVTTAQLKPIEHVRMQAAIQAWTDASISKTINMPRETTVDQVREVYWELWSSGCKGGTIYRDGSRDVQVLRAPDPVVEAAPQAPQPKQIPSVRPSMTASRTTPGGRVHVHLTVDKDSGDPLELFCDSGRSGSETHALMEAMGRLASLVLRVNDSMTPRQRLEEIAQQLRGIGGSNSVGMGPNRVLSIADGVALALWDAWQGLSGSHDKAPSPEGLDLCPSCQNTTLQKASGCEDCSSCGYSRC